MQINDLTVAERDETKNERNMIDTTNKGNNNYITMPKLKLKADNLLFLDKNTQNASIRPQLKSYGHR